MANSIDYASATARPRPGFVRRTFISLIYIGCIGVGLFFVFSFFIWLAVIRPMDKLTITVTNHTTSTIDIAGIFDRPTDTKAIISVGPVPPGGTASATTHFGKDYGTSPLVITQGGVRRCDTIGCLLTDNGPYTYEIVVNPSGVHISGDVASKGSGSWDWQPTTVP